MRAFIYDTETCSALDLKDSGSWLYARHRTTDLRCLSWCLVIDGVRGPIETWWPGDPVPQAVLDFAADPDAIAIAFNDAFDRQIWDQILVPRYGWPSIPLERHRCAQAAALARALPGSLDGAAAALKLKTRKTAKGSAAMKRLAGPKKQTKKQRQAGAPLDFSATPEDLETLGEYNRLDVLMTMEIVDRIGLLGESEQALWQLDQQFNERGTPIDVALLESGLLLAQQAKAEIREQLAMLTGGRVNTPDERDKILPWLKEHDCALPNFTKGAVANALLNPRLSDPARALLELRQSAAGNAGAKFKTLLRWVPETGEPRIRFAYRFHGASSGRFSSLGVQLQSLKKPELADVRAAIAAVATGSLAEMRRRGFDRPLETIGHITRAVFAAPKGRRFFIADLSGIEDRGAAHIVGAHAELEQWRIFDRTKQPEDEPYYRAGITSFQQPPEKARKAGKTGSLAFKYGGGIPAYRKVSGDATSPDRAITERRDAWRQTHPDYVRFWRLLVFQAVQAIKHPGQEFTARTISFRFDQQTGFLELTLPSGRALTYPQAELFEDPQYGDLTFTFLDASGSRTGRMYHKRKGSGVFGGLLLENVTQAACRDIFVEAMPRLEAAGYPIVMHTHDDFVCEVADDFGSLEEFQALITAPPSWAPDLPVAAKARISDRFIEITEPAKAENVVTDNAIDNAAAPDDPEEAENGEGEDEETITIPETTPPEPILICAHCHLELPAGPDRVSAHDGGGWLHPGCVDPFTQVRMGEEGIPWENPSSAASVPRPPPPPPPPPPQPRTFNGRGNGGYPCGESTAGMTAETYIYKDAAGRLFMRVDRKVREQADENGKRKKSFPTAYWHAGDWIWEWPKEVVPYRLPELLAAPADAIVLITEGENGADAAAKLGFIATTNPGGAGKWQPELAQYFKGKQRVCIVEDNDEAGTGHTALILKALTGVVPEIGMLRFPELPPGGDLVDFFKEGGTREYLLARIERAMKAKGPASAEIEAWNAGELLSGPEPEPREWLIGGTFCRTFLSGLVAPGDAGKTTLRLTQAVELATGRELLGRRIYLRARVLVLCLEDDKRELHRRLRAICKHHQIDPAELDGWLFCDNLKKTKLAIRGAEGQPAPGPLDGMLRRAIERYRCDLVILDPFVKLHALAENVNEDMDFVCELLIDIAQTYNIAIDLPAHTHKGTLTAGDADARRGASAQRDAGRLDYTLTVMAEAEAKQFGIPPDQRKSYVRLDKAKANIVRAMKAAWFRLASVPLGNATERYPEGDEVQAIECWNPPEIWEAMEPEALNAILDDIEAGLANGQRYSKLGQARKRAAWPVVQKHCPAKTEAQCREIIRQWCETGVLIEADYDDPVRREPVSGLQVDSSKRPQYPTAAE